MPHPAAKMMWQAYLGIGQMANRPDARRQADYKQPMHICSPMLLRHRVPGFLTPAGTLLLLAVFLW